MQETGIGVVPFVSPGKAATGNRCWFSAVGNVTGSFAEGETSPKISEAMPVP